MNRNNQLKHQSNHYIMNNHQLKYNENIISSENHEKYEESDDSHSESSNDDNRPELSSRSPISRDNSSRKNFISVLKKNLKEKNKKYEHECGYSIYRLFRGQSIGRSLKRLILYTILCQYCVGFIFLIISFSIRKLLCHIYVYVVVMM